MKGELLYVYHPIRTRIFWAIVYVVLLVGVTIGLFAAGSQIRTHTIPVGGIGLTVPYSKYLVGENINFTIKNNFNSAIYVVNKCPSEPLSVFKQENGVWVPIHDTATEGGCSDESRRVSVPANSTTTGSFAAWPHLFDTPGKYRIVALVEYYNALPYQDFEVIAKPEVPKSTSTSSSASSSSSSSSSTTQQKTTTPTTTTPTTTYQEPGDNEPNDN